MTKGATADEVRKAFRKLAKQYHPDTNPGDKASEEKFKRVSAAFDILGDAEKRAKFDRGEIDADGRETMRGFGGGQGRQGPWGPHGGQQQSAQFDGVDLGDILGEMFGARGGQRGRAGGFSPPPTKGADVRGKVEIDLEEAIAGAKKRLAFSDGRTIEVAIPKGAADGQTLRLKGQGEGGRGGPGDALIEISIRPHPIYRREGDQLVMDVPISVPDAVLGGKVTAPTPEGSVALTVPKGANSGQTLRLKGRGMPGPGNKRGDLLARLVVTLPDAADPKLEAFAEKWRAERPYTPKRRGVSVRFGSLALGAGKPAVAVSFTDGDTPADVAAAKDAGVAIAELRIDLFADASVANVVETARRLSGLPLLATIRMSEEGGAWTGGEAKRQALFEAVLPHVDAMDIELRAADTLVALAPKIRAAGKALVVSHHDFAATPSPDELADIARRARDAGADVVKIAATIVDEDDLAALADLLTSRPAPNLVVIGMGERGLVTRLLFPALGSLFTFAGKGERASAPGQLSYERTLALLSTLYPG